MKISIKNFRVFKEKTEFEIRPLTVLVGPNNSGKSSFTKLLLLLKNGYENLDFTTGDHHLGSYNQALNWDLKEAGDDEILINAQSSYPFLDDLFIEERTYHPNGKTKKIAMYRNSILDNGVVVKTPILSGTSVGRDTSPQDITGFPKQTSYILDIEYFINIFYKRKLLLDVPFAKSKSLWFQRKSKKFMLSDFIDSKKFDREKADWINTYKKDIYISNFLEVYKDPVMENYPDFITNSVIINELSKMNQDFLLYNLYFDKKNVTNTDAYVEEIRRLQKEYFGNITFGTFYPNKDTFLLLYEYIRWNIETYFKEKHTDFEDVIEVLPTNLGKLLFKAKLFPRKGNLDEAETNYVEFERTFFEQVVENSFIELEKFKDTESIPANRGNQRRTLLSLQNNNTYQTTILFEKNQTEDEKESFVRAVFAPNAEKNLRKMLKVIGIEEEIRTKRLEDAMAVYIIKQGKEINLADYGFGYSQLIPIILKLYNLMVTRGVSGYVIIEEPEANLHPALQSKLADIFSIAILDEYNWKIIIETHSEYFIRKLQYLTAKQELKTKDCIIHYFNSDENVTREEPKVKPIEINEEGNLTDNFGPGFYDEATRLQFELLKLNRNQSN